MLHCRWSSRTFCRVLLLLIATATSSNAQLETLETEHLRVIYIAPIHSYLAPYAAQCFENSLAFQKRLFDYEPDEKITVILTDFSDYGNAGAGAVPRRDRKSTRLNSSHTDISRMPSSA